MKSVTAWSAWNKDKERFEHNHIEDGWVNGEYPKPLNPEFTLQKSWKGKKWKKEFCILTSDNIVKTVKNA